VWKVPSLDKKGEISRHSKPSNNKNAVAFALIGDRFHNSDYIRTALGKTLVREAGLSINFTDEVTMLSAETLKCYKMVIIFRDGIIWPNGYPDKVQYPGYFPSSNYELTSDPPLLKIDSKPKAWMSQTQGKALREFVEDGGCALFYHNSSQISISNKHYRDVEGAIYTGHPPVRPFKIKIVNKSHPITRGVNNFIVTDEQHYVKYDKESKYVLMMSENENNLRYSGSIGDQGTSCEAGWAYDYDNGRVCFMAPGHLISALWNPEYEKLQKNAIKWLLKEI
jgi:hypothetical protein